MEEEERLYRRYQRLAATSTSIGHQPGRFKKGHGKPRTSIDMLICCVRRVKNLKQKMWTVTIYIASSSNKFTPNANYIADIYGSNVAVNDSIVITLTCHAELTHSRT